MNISVNVNKKQLDYLDEIIFEDGVATENGTGNRSMAIKYCIDMCRQLEKLHGKDHFNEVAQMAYKEKLQK